MQGTHAPTSVSSTSGLTSEHKAILDRTKELVRSRPSLFVGAGRMLDDDKLGYSNRAIQHREAKAKYNWYLQGREARQSSTRFCTRAAWRKIYGQRSLAGRPWPKTWSKMARFNQAWDDIFSCVQACPFDQRKQIDCHKLACSIVLLTSILADPDANDLETKVTDFQNWGWNEDLGVSDHPTSVFTSFDSDEQVGRHYARMDKLDNHASEYISTIDEALAILENSITAGSHGNSYGTSSLTVPLASGFSGFITSNDTGTLVELANVEQISDQAAEVQSPIRENAAHQTPENDSQTHINNRVADESDPDENGYVKRPHDFGDYIPVSKILSDFCHDLPFNMTAKMVGEVAENFSLHGVRWTRPYTKGEDARPRKKRRSIHRDDWKKYVARLRSSKRTIPIVF